MDLFAAKDDAERLLLFRETANSRGVTPIIIEKDFWVCWTLKRLYENPELAPYLTFKGGTSLAKAYGLIERFSEDIDLTISRDAPHVNEVSNLMEADISGKERRRRLDLLTEEKAPLFVEQVVLPNLAAGISHALGRPNGWEIVLDEKDKQTLLFRYPKTLDYTGYIQPQIKLEFGARGEKEPNESRSVQAYIAESLPQLFNDCIIQVPTLAAKRSFWEKVTILHALHHGSKQRDRMSRHYYDTYMMAEKGVADVALENVELLEQVVLNKSLLFRDSNASYETAIIGSLRLVPGEELLAVLKKDYEAMSEMFMSEPSRFDKIITKLCELENRINQST